MSADRASTGASWTRRVLRPWLIVPLVALLAVGGWFAFGHKDKAGQASATSIERTVDVTSGTLARTVSASGTISAADTEDLSFSSSGTVTAVNVKAGDAVKKGQVLATIDSASLRASVTEAEASVADAEAKLSSDQTASATSAQIAADESNLASLQAQLTSAQTALAGAELVSPITGTIATVDLTVGQQLGGNGTSGTRITGTGTGSGQSSATLGSGSGSTGAGATQGAGSSTSSSTSSGQIEVISTGSYVVKLNVDDTDIANVEVGQRASVTLASAAARSGFFRNRGFGAAAGGVTTTTQPTASTSSASVTGLVTTVGTVATGTSGVATFPVDVRFNGSATTYHEGATAQVEITYDSIANAIQVPTQAVTTTNAGATVMVAVNGRKQRREVRTGLTSNGMVQVTSGLNAGEQVVVSIPTARRTTTGGTGAGAGAGGGFPLPPGFSPGARGAGAGAATGRGPG